MHNRADYNFIVKYGEITPDGVAVYDLNTRTFVYRNRFLSNIFEGDDEGFQQNASAIMKLVHPEDLSYVEDRYRELLSIGCIAPTEFRISVGGLVKHVSCEVLWLEESYSFAIFARDITSVKEHEDYVVKFTAQKDTLLDMLVHNLSAPLYMSRDVLKAIHGDEENLNGADTNNQFTLLRDSTEHCIDIINEFIKGEHEESTLVSLKSSRFDIPEKLEIAVKMLRAMNKHKNFEIKAQIKNRNISTDPIKFLQVIHNLLSNSVKYTARDGLVMIEAMEEGQWVHFIVRDNGIGIPAALLPQLMKQRVYGTPGLQGEKSNGTGLYIVGQLVEIMRGKVSIESAENEGCTVTVSLPRE
jgi:two-component system, OmpR family, sensor histidine kinase VicK